VLFQVQRQKTNCFYPQGVQGGWRDHGGLRRRVKDLGGGRGWRSFTEERTFDPSLGGELQAARGQALKGERQLEICCGARDCRGPGNVVQTQGFECHTKELELYLVDSG